MGSQCDECYALETDGVTYTLPDCSICYWQMASGTTLDPDFTPYFPASALPVTAKLCGLCQPGYILSANKLTCTIVPIASLPQPNCLIFETAGSNKYCSVCASGYTLDKITGSGTFGTCLQGCAFDISDFFCSSCYQY